MPGIQKLLPEAWNRYPQFKAIHQLEAVPVATVQLRYDGWVTELGEAQEARRRDVATPTGLNNLLYTADADFSCFADLALASPEDYRKEGEGSLLQCVLTPGDPWIPKSVDEIVAHTDRQVRELVPLGPQSQAHLEQRCETGAVVVPRSPWHGALPPGAAHADP